MKDNNYYFIVYYWMFELNLTKSELIIFALIHGLNRYEIQKKKRIGIKELRLITHFSRTHLYKTINSLINKQLIEKIEYSINSDRIIEFKSTYNEDNINYIDIISNYFNNNEIRKLIFEYIKVRKISKKPLTNYALEQLLIKLKNSNKTDEEIIQIINNSIKNNYSDFYIDYKPNINKLDFFKKDKEIVSKWEENFLDEIMEEFKR